MAGLFEGNQTTEIGTNRLGADDVQDRQLESGLLSVMKPYKLPGLATVGLCGARSYVGKLSGHDNCCSYTEQ